MIDISRRNFLVAGGAILTSACAGGTDRNASVLINQKIEIAIDEMETKYPFTKSIMERSTGLLVIPEVREASLIVGGMYGEGALLIDQIPVDYYSFAAGSVGFKIGVQSVNHFLFFLDDGSLRRFRGRDGWAVGADLEFTVIDKSNSLAVSSETHRRGVYSLSVTKTGVLFGTAIEGGKFSRIAR